MSGNVEEQEKGYYWQRRLLRRLEALWVLLERGVNRVTGVSYNPLYHLGTLTIALLIILGVTGTYLTIFYRPGADRAYETVAGISATWWGLMIRSVHRYAADALMVVIFLHALKMFLSDRFWGARWLAWVSGWVLLAVIWSIGVMGYWLVWDERAQWLTEYMIDVLRGPTAMAFLSQELASRVFAFFVIVLFLHIFLSVIIAAGVLIHELRLSRARYWPPRWLIVQATLVLIVLAALWPVSSGVRADLNRLVGIIQVNVWYLGFLPLATWWGGRFWLLATVVLLAVMALPWLLRGRQSGPAQVTDELCTGCTLCFQECPYEAIQMVPAPGQTPTGELAVVRANLCTGCGICVGTCAVTGIGLVELPTAQVRAELQQCLADARARGESPVVVYTCQRHAVLGGLMSTAQEPVLRPEAEVPIALPGAGAAPVTCVHWGGGNPHPPVPVLISQFPCTGMLNPAWVKEDLDGGARAVVILSCPADDCGFREGPRWIFHRLRRRTSLLHQGVYMVEAAPGDRKGLDAVLAHIAASEDGEHPIPEGAGYQVLLHPTAADAPAPASGVRRWLSPAMASGVVVLGLLFGLAIQAQWTVQAMPTDQGVVRLVMMHLGKLKAAARALDPTVQAQLPSSVDVEQVLGGERYPVHLRLEVDGVQVGEYTYNPSGLRKEGPVFVVESEVVPPGEHEVRVWVMDDGETWREVFNGRVTVEPGRVLTLIYDKELDRFLVE